MRNFLSKNIATVIITGATLTLAGLAVFTAIRLYNLRRQPVALNTPTSEPQAASPTPQSACQLSFTLSFASSSPTASPKATATPKSSATPTPTPTKSPSPTPTATPTEPLIGGNPTPTPTTTPTVTSTPHPTATPATLPNAGTSWPTVAVIMSGVLLLLASIILAL